MSDLLTKEQTGYRGLLRLAGPLIVSMSGYLFMQFIDAVFLSWYSPAAIAAVAPAGMVAWFLISVFNGMAGYTAVLASHCVGAGRSDRIASVAWQGMYVAAGSGLLVAAAALVHGPLFAWVGHAPEVRALEETYFIITCCGAPLALLDSAVSGFFTGLGRTRVVMAVHLAGMAVNAILDYAMIFGFRGFPAMGVAGAATATVIAQGVSVLSLLVLFGGRGPQAAFGTRGAWRPDGFLLGRLIRFGFPSGSRFAIEMLAWTVFLFFVGRLGTLELVATNIAWRINGIAFFPVVGLSQAVAILVGHAQGARRPDLSRIVTRRGLVVTQAWMVSGAALFLLAPEVLYAVFQRGDPAADPAFMQQVSAVGVILLRFVAAYCLLDGFNLMILGTLQAAGDTRWTFVVSALLHAVFVSTLWLADWTGAGLYAQWTLATAFVLLQGLVWWTRYLEGAWRTIRVVEPDFGDGRAG